MLVFVKQNLAYLAMTKTGSTAIEAAFAPYCDIAMSGNPRLKHMQLRRFNRFVRPMLASYGAEQVETVTTIRHPVDWLSSWFRYRQRSEIAGRPNSTAEIEFNQFVDAYLSDDVPPYAEVGRQSRFVEAPNGGPSLTYAYRYENLPGLIRFLSDRVGVAPTVERLNVSPPGDPDLSPALLARLKAERAEDFELFERAIV